MRLRPASDGRTKPLEPTAILWLVRADCSSRVALPIRAAAQRRRFGAYVVMKFFSWSLLILLSLPVPSMSPALTLDPVKTVVTPENADEQTVRVWARDDASGCPGARDIWIHVPPSFRNEPLLGASFFAKDDAGDVMLMHAIATTTLPAGPRPECPTADSATGAHPLCWITGFRGVNLCIGPELQRIGSVTFSYGSGGHIMGELIVRKLADWPAAEPSHALDAHKDARK